MGGLDNSLETCLLTEMWVQCQSITYSLEIQARFLFFPLHNIKMSKQHRFILQTISYIQVNVNHYQSVHIPLSVLPVWEQGILWQLSKQISKLFFQMSAQVYSVPGRTKGRRKAFLEWKNIDLSYEVSLTCGGNVNYYKSVHHPIPTPDKREHPGNFQNKLVSSAFN